MERLSTILPLLVLVLLTSISGCGKSELESERTARRWAEQRLQAETQARVHERHNAELQLRNEGRKVAVSNTLAQSLAALGIGAILLLSREYRLRCVLQRIMERISKRRQTWRE